jgi:hypothetical protein
MVKMIHITEDGDDKRDGLSLESSVHSWKRARKLQGGDSSVDMFVSGASVKRIKKEIAGNAKKKAKKKT